MKKNKLTIIINKPLHKVFEFTINPSNTHLRISSIRKEMTDQYPPAIGTIYKNRGDSNHRNVYKVIAFEKNKLFTLSDLNDNYYVQYSYKSKNAQETKMEYFERMRNGELESPFTANVLEQLKSVMEQS